MIVRPALCEDAPAIHELTVFMGYQCTLEDFRARLEEILGAAENEIFLACDDVALAGWVHIFVARRLGVPGFVEIGGIVIREQHQRRGVGRLLIAQCESWARDKYYTSMRVRCSTLRPEAHAFYQAAAFDMTKSQFVFEKRL